MLIFFSKKARFLLKNVLISQVFFELYTTLINIIYFTSTFKKYDLMDFLFCINSIVT